MTAVRIRRRLVMFDALQNRHYRWFWLGMLASSATMEMSGVAQGWLVYELAGSALALGWVSSGWSIANSILSPFGGVISDRMEKRQLLLWTRGIMALSALAITGLVALGVVQVWHMAAYSLFRGVLFALLMPAQNAYLADLVDRRTMLNALSLNSIGMGLAGIFSSSLAGLLIDTIGVHSVFLAIALLYLVVCLTMLKLPSTGRSNPGGRSVWSDLGEGLGYLRIRSIMVPLLGLVFARGLLAMPYRTFMPKYAQDVMGLDAKGLGILMAAPGAGSLVSALVLASLGDFRGKGRLLMAAGVIMGVALVLFANTQLFVPVLLLLGIVGATGNICMVTNQALIQANCDAPFLGRVMSAYMLMFGLTQLGTIPTGALADRLGVPLVVALQGGLFALVFVLVLFLLPRLRRLE
jgi:MFS family permease